MPLFSSYEIDGFSNFIRTEVEEFICDNVDRDVEIHIDYSCMPRRWYSNIINVMAPLFRDNDVCYLWYTPGKYPEREYPTAGIEDFQVFSGKPSLNAKFRTHVFGLGFDNVRSRAIWSVIDPENLICVIATPIINIDYEKIVRECNKYIIRSANHVINIPIDDFTITYSKLSEIVHNFSRLGDVILVPDGPKPLILAASLIPFFVKSEGVVCFHVTRRHSKDFKPIDVSSLGDPVGFSFSFRKTKTDQK